MNFEYRLYGLDGYSIAEATADSWIPSGSDLTEHSACWGSAYPGNWRKGDYRYSIHYKPEGTVKHSALEYNIKFTIY